MSVETKWCNKFRQLMPQLSTMDVFLLARVKLQRYCAAVFMLHMYNITVKKENKIEL